MNNNEDEKSQLRRSQSKQQSFLKKYRLIQLLGGLNLPYVLILIILFSLAIILLSRITFIFTPLVVVFDTLVAPLIVSLVLFYLFNPIINIMQRYGINRMISILLIYLMLIFAHLALINLVMPSIIHQGSSLIDKIPTYIKNIEYFINHLDKYSPFVNINYRIKEHFNSLMTHYPDYLKEYSQNLSGNASKVIEKLTSVASVFLTVPFILFFMLKDGHKFRIALVNIVPPAFRRDYIYLFNEINLKVGSYIQGQMIVSICIGVLLFIGYSVIGLKYSLILACIAAVTSVVPYLGPAIAISPAIIIAMITSPVMLIKLIIVWTLVQFIEGHFISPNIMGKALKIHPLTIIFVLLCAGKLGGVVFIILGIPFYAVLKVIIIHCYELYKKKYNELYGKEGGLYDTYFDDDH